MPRQPGEPALAWAWPGSCEPGFADTRSIEDGMLALQPRKSALDWTVPGADAAAPHQVGTKALDALPPALD